MSNETPPVNSDNVHPNNAGGEPQQLNNRWLYAIITGSFIFAFGSIPLYRIVCKRIDPGGSSWQNGDAEIYKDTADTSRNIRVRFTTSVERQLPFEFKSEQEFLTFHPGAKTVAHFTVRNMDNERDYRAKAVYDINPPEAGQYLKKIECFCFNEQTIGAKETKDLPLVFWFESDMPDHIKDITIAYTYFNVENSMERSIRKREQHAKND